MRQEPERREREPDLSGARLAARRLIEEFGITCPDQIVVEDIAWDRKVQVKTGPIVGAEAWLLRKKHRGLIRVRDGIRETGRRRFSIAHELGHWERHMDLSQAWLCTTDDIHAYRGSAAELEANAFGAELLMPRPLFRPRLDRGVSLAVVRALADEFRTTLTATAVRAVEEASENCYVVFSLNGQVRWWRRNEQRSAGYFARRHSISSDSFALGCTDDPSLVPEMAPVPWEAWFPGQQNPDGAEVWEQSVLLREYDTVLTLLCIA